MGPHFIDLLQFAGGILTAIIAATGTYFGVKRNAKVASEEAETKRTIEGERLASEKWRELSGHFEERLEKAEANIASMRQAQDEQEVRHEAEISDLRSEMEAIATRLRGIIRNLLTIIRAYRSSDSTRIDSEEMDRIIAEAEAASANNS